MGFDVLKTGVYIHIPFCLTKCGYCSFFSVPYSQKAFSNYLSYLQDEIKSFKQRFNFEADTVYLGGGTPSLLTAEQIRSILFLINPEKDAEVTLEVNPVQITQEWVKAVSETGINRLSLGIQSMHNDKLSALGRKHKAESVPERIRLLREHGFDNISLDLLYGLPYFSDMTIEQELESFLELNPEHISTYLLTIDERVEFKHWKSILPPPETCEQQYNTICEKLAQAGFEQYEISNFAIPDKQSRHNLHYWLDEDCLGIGAGASGFVNGQRYRRPDDLELWQYSVEKQDILYEKESETKAQQKADFIIMQMRLIRGLDINAYKQRFGTDFLTDYNEIIERFIASGHLKLEGNNISLTPSARFVSNHILREFV